MTTPDTEQKTENQTVRIKLLHYLPVDPKHKANKGNVYDAEIVTEGERGTPHFWIIGAAGERVGVFQHEAEVVEPSE